MPYSASVGASLFFFFFFFFFFLPVSFTNVNGIRDMYQLLPVSWRVRRMYSGRTDARRQKCFDIFVLKHFVPGKEAQQCTACTGVGLCTYVANGGDPTPVVLTVPLGMRRTVYLRKMDSDINIPARGNDNPLLT